MSTDTRGRFSIKKLGNYFRPGKASEARMKELLDRVHRADLIMQEERNPTYHTVVVARLTEARERDYQKLMNTHDNSEKDKLIGSIAAIDRFFSDIRADKKAGEEAATELQKIKQEK